MDTVYLRGMLAQQPFRIEGNRAYGLGIADDKQGIAVILHTLAILQAQMNFRDYGLLTVLINADEEMSSPGSRATLTKLGGEHDVVFSCEGTRVDSDRLSLTTAGIAAVVLNVKGRASHAGAAPERGRNALYELAHQILQTRDLSDPAIGLKMNWTVANAGTNRNVIPANASATADVRVLRIADYDGIEKKVRERIKNKLIEDTTVEMTFERRRPPLESTAGVARTRQAAQAIYAEIGRTLTIGDVAEGGGTDAAFAALSYQGAGAGTLRPARLRLPLERCRIHRCRFDRAAALSADAYDYGRFAREDELRRSATAAPCLPRGRRFLTLGPRCWSRAAPATRPPLGRQCENGLRRRSRVRPPQALGPSQCNPADRARRPSSWPLLSRSRLHSA